MFFMITVFAVAFSVLNLTNQYSTNIYLKIALFYFQERFFLTISNHIFTAIFTVEMTLKVSVDLKLFRTHNVCAWANFANIAVFV